MTDVAAGNIWEVDIVQLKQANATMPLANQALASDDVATLTAFGFSHAHVRVTQRRHLEQPSLPPLVQSSGTRTAEQLGT